LPDEEHDLGGLDFEDRRRSPHSNPSKTKSVIGE